MAKKTLTQKMDERPHEIATNRDQKVANREAMRKSMGKLLARNMKRFNGNWDLALEDEWLMGRLYDMLSSGNYVETAVMAAGIPKGVYSRWRAKGVQDLETGVDSGEAMFVQGLEALHAQSEAAMVEKIYESAMAGEKLPVGFCWLLERGRGHRFKQNAPPAAAQQTNVQVNVLGVSAPAPAQDYDTWLKNKKATDQLIAERPEIGRPEEPEIPVEIETVVVES